MSLHEVIYGDVKHVREVRVQAQGRIAWRRIKYELVYRWLEPMVAWLVRKLDR